MLKKALRRSMAARRLLYLNSDKSKDNSYRRQLSNSFESNDSSQWRDFSQKSSSHISLKQPQSATALRPLAHQMNSLHFADLFYSSDEQKLQKAARSPMMCTTPLLCSRKESSHSAQKHNSKQIIRRPRSTDVIKVPEVKNSGTDGGGGSGGGMGWNNGISGIQRPTISTTKSPVISSNSQSIILFCMENARSDLAQRIIQRMTHKRNDFAQFYTNLNSEQCGELANALKKFLTDIVQNIANPEKIKGISNHFGIEQAYKRSWGFKADFFAVLADALTTECVFLDGATHQPTETIEAWATLVELMFTHVRDGYYQQIRQLRRSMQSVRSHSNMS